ncbi:MAG: NAD(P)-binding domain-containing protein, partial [bacterium]
METNATVEKLRGKILDRSARIAIVGVGYVGLPLGVNFAEAGYFVEGFDVNQEAVVKLNTGKSTIKDIPSERLRPLVTSGKFRASCDEAILDHADVIFICVPTPLTRNKTPDLSYIVKASETIANHLKPGQLIVLESTTYPGTTVEIVKPCLDSRGFTEGTDYFLVFSPERVNPGDEVYSIKNTPKVIGGCSEISTDLCCRL